MLCAFARDIPLKLAVKLESLGKPPRQAFALAGALGTLGVQGVQMDAVGDLSPDSLSATGRRDVRNRLRALNLQGAALGCPLRHGLDAAGGLEVRVAYVKKVLQLAYDLGPRLVIFYPGALRLEDGRPADLQVLGGLSDLARHGERVGARLALETGPETPEAVQQFVAPFSTEAIGLNLDPATRLRYGQDPRGAARVWGERLLHVHARDARPGRPDQGLEEVPLGHGDVDWVGFLGALEEVGYTGWLTIQRAPTPDPVAELRAAARFLRGLGLGDLGDPGVTG